MGRNFYYGSDARVVAGSANFAALIGAAAESFGLAPELAAQYQALDAVLQDAYRAAVTPETRTRVAVREKDDALRNVQRRASVLAAIVTRAAGVSDGQLVSLGLQPRRPRRAIAGPPATVPTVEVANVVGRIVRLRIHARTTEGTRLAAGAVAAHVWSYVGEEPPDDPRRYRPEAYVPRGTCEIVFPDDVPSGATAWLSAAWVSRRGKHGAACPPVRVTVQGGPVLAAAA